LAGQGITRLQDVQPVHVAAYIEQLGQEMSPPSVKQHLAAIRMLFDWLVTGQVAPSNPAHSVRGCAIITVVTYTFAHVGPSSQKVAPPPREKR